MGYGKELCRGFRGIGVADAGTAFLVTIMLSFGVHAEQAVMNDQEILMPGHTLAPMEM